MVGVMKDVKGPGAAILRWPIIGVQCASGPGSLFLGLRGKSGLAAGHTVDPH